MKTTYNKKARYEIWQGESNVRNKTSILSTSNDLVTANMIAEYLMEGPIDFPGIKRGDAYRITEIDTHAILNNEQEVIVLEKIL